MWMACSPGGKPFRFNAILTPLPPAPSEILAVPTSFPDPSFRATVTGLLAACSDAPSKPNTAKAISLVVIDTSPLASSHDRARFAGARPFAPTMYQYDV